MYVVFDDHSKGAWMIENTRIIFCNNILQILGLSYKDMLVVLLYDHSKGSGIIPSWLPQHLDKSKSPGISFTIQQVDEERVCIFSTDNVFCISISTCVSVSSDGL